MVLTVLTVQNIALFSRDMIYLYIYSYLTQPAQRDHFYCHGINSDETHMASAIIRITNTYKPLHDKPPCDVKDMAVIVAAYREEVRRMANVNEWAGLWQFYQLSNVLRRPVRTVYPNLSAEMEDLRWDYNRTVYPFESKFRDRRAVYIMWSKGDKKSTSFNHFVAVVP